MKFGGATQTLKHNREGEEIQNNEDLPPPTVQTDPVLCLATQSSRYSSLHVNL